MLISCYKEHYEGADSSPRRLVGSNRSLPTGSPGCPGLRCLLQCGAFRAETRSAPGTETVGHPHSFLPCLDQKLTPGGGLTQAQGGEWSMGLTYVASNSDPGTLSCVTLGRCIDLPPKSLPVKILTPHTYDLFESYQIWFHNTILYFSEFYLRVLFLPKNKQTSV